MKELKDYTDDELRTEARSLYQAIYVIDCLSVKDLVFFELACRELERRGYTVMEQKNLVVEKD